MKKYVLMMLLLTVSFICISCGEKDENVISDYNEVKYALQKYSVTYDANNNKMAESFYNTSVYNAIGQLLYVYDENNTQITEWIYDENGELESYYEVSTVIDYVVKKYYVNGVITSKYVLKDGRSLETEIWKYNEEQNLVLYTNVNDSRYDLRDDYSYENGILVKREHYQTEKNKLEELVYIENYLYDGNNNLIKVEKTYFSNGKQGKTVYWIYEYDKNGNKVSEKEHGTNNNIEYHYTYYDNNKMNSRTTYYDGQVNSKSVYDIEGRVTESWQKEGEVKIVYGYDEEGRIVKETIYKNSQLFRTTIYEYRKLSDTDFIEFMQMLYADLGSDFY